MIYLQCACGAELQVAELYAGGHVVCHACKASVSVPADSAAEERFRFQCPHCHARIVARKAAAGKKTQCPACELVCIVPEPPEVDPAAPKDRRIEIETDDLALRFGLPFDVGKADTGRAAPPQPRYLHSGSEPIDDVSPTVVLPPPGLPKGNASESSSPLPPVVSEPTLILGNGWHQEAPPTAESPRIDEYSSAWDDSSAAPTAAAIPEMGIADEPARIGELRVLSGNCRGQRIRLDFHHFVVGSERDCNLRPVSRFLSRHHCVFKKDEYSLRIRDLGSAGGTFVNGRRILNEVILKPGDEVKIADVRFHVLLPESPQVIHLTADSAPSISDFVIL